MKKIVIRKLFGEMVPIEAVRAAESSQKSE